MSKDSTQKMNDSFEIKGVWYLPGKNLEQDGVKGVLKYNPDRIILDLIGTFEETEKLNFFVSDDQLIKLNIYGFSNAGEWLSLFSCLEIKSLTCFPGFGIVTYAVDHFYVGKQLIENENDKIIEDLTFSFTYLDAWMNVFITEEQKHETGKMDFIIDLNKAYGQKKHFQIDLENIVFEEKIGYSIKYASDYFSNETTDIIINRFYKLSSIDKSCFSYNMFKNHLHNFRRLLTILVGKPLYFLYIDLNLPQIKDTNYKGEQFEIPNHSRLFFRQIGDINKSLNITPKNSQSALFFRKHISNIELVFNNWFSEINLLSEVINPYINDLYLPSYENIIFLNAVRSLETFHRSFIDNKKSADKNADNSVSGISKDRELIASFIQQNIDKENQAFFLDRVNYEDEKSLQKRLKEVFEQTPISLLDRLFENFDTKSKNRIFQTIVQTRNYYTHRDNKNKYPLAVMDVFALNYYTKRLNILLQYHVFKYLGIDSETIEERLIEHSNGI